MKQPVVLRQPHRDLIRLFEAVQKLSKIKSIYHTESALNGKHLCVRQGSGHRIQLAWSDGRVLLNWTMDAGDIPGLFELGGTDKWAAVEFNRMAKGDYLFTLNENITGPQIDQVIPDVSGWSSFELSESSMWRGHYKVPFVIAKCFAERPDWFLNPELCPGAVMDLFTTPVLYWSQDEARHPVIIHESASDGGLYQDLKWLWMPIKV